METRSPLALGRPAVEIPWKLSLFLLAIFALAYPFNPAHSHGPMNQGIDETAGVIKDGSMTRPIALSLLCFFALVSLYSRKCRRLRVDGPLGWFLISYFFLATASPLWAEDPFLTVRRLGVLVFLSLGATAVAARYSELKIAALTVCVCGLTLMISLAVEIASGTLNPFDGEWRFSGVIYSVAQGWNCGLLVIASLALARFVPKSKGRYLLLACIAFVFLVLTRSRMPLASTVIAAALSASMISRKARQLTFVSIYLLICVSLLLILLGGNIGGIGKDVATLGRGEDASSSLGTFTGRLGIWNEVLRRVKERPIFGYGYDSFFNSRNLPSVSEAAGWVPASAHSGYLEVLVGIGMSGAAVFVLTLLLALTKSYILTRNNPTYMFSAAVMLWLVCNLFLESTIFTDATFPTFVSLTVLTSLAFKEAETVSLLGKITTKDTVGRSRSIDVSHSGTVFANEGVS